MDLFIPYITRAVEPVNKVSENNTSHKYDNISVPSSGQFQKVYFEELARKCYEEEGSFESVSNIARVHYEEYYGAGSQRLKRWKLYFTKYNILVNIEDNNGILQIKAA